ncbi:MAG: MBL fold metallo-hydrolase [Flavobacteriales bacterium]|nr:MBL fold metallo-hydrolase [Flavobacteriales bacterium]
MISLRKFTFNAFAENTYLLYDETKQAIIIDPGMMDNSEERLMLNAIAEEELNPVKVVLTHGHIDHVLGVDFCMKKFGIPLVSHKKALPTIGMAEQVSRMYGLPFTTCPDPTEFIEEGEQLTFGNSSMDVLFVPGHAPGHVAFVDHDGKKVIAGDVLFQGSVGRVDLPGGDAPLLAKSIQEKMYALPDEMIVYCGHGPETTIGIEKQSNPFVRPGFSAF